MMLIPLIIKLASFVLIAALGMEEQYLRQGLILLPSFFAEGWLIAQIVRLAILKESWPAVLSGDRRKDMKILHVRFRAIMAGTIIYVLTKLVISLISGLAMQANESFVNQEVVEPTNFGFLTALLVVAFTIWAFRFLWLYIPAALDFPMRDFVYRIRAFKVSILMIATWLLCFIPLALIFLMISELLTSFFPLTDAGEIPDAFKYIMIGFQAILEMLIAIVSSVAMAFGLMSFYDHKGIGR